ncbi:MULTISPECIES: hypothetical protein [unclassified Nitrobacter]|uniref:hypothetical protein n=1 Tax=unclassified Nitrobacter TaxID=2620411 RepID=UPI00103E7CB1|nr:MULTISPECIES: hypothetical protein [unclassified Nitrobacter]MCB1392900.1 hypothetical protein [Nitrobacter sp.]MCV0386844.1 hypothetical protein [Nitrobacter sp.]
MKALQVLSVPHQGAIIKRTLSRLGRWMSDVFKWSPSGSRLGTGKPKERERTTRRILAILTMFAILFGTSQVAAMERPHSTRHQADPAAKVRVVSPDQSTANQKVTRQRAFSITSDFRADELIPDICKGCSS